MKNQKKLIVIIDKFPKILYMITQTLRDEKVDFILDASGYTRPVPLLRIACPDNLVLNMGLSREQAIELASEYLQGADGSETRKGMITGNPRAYYMSLCGTLRSNYAVDQFLDLESVPGAIARQQLN